MSAQDPVYIRFILYMFVTDSVTGRLQDETWYIANTLRTSTGYVKYKTDIYRKRTAFFCPVISVTTFEHVQNSLPYMPDIDWHGTHLTDDNSIYTVYIPYFNGYQRTGKKGVRFLSVSSIRWYVTGPLSTKQIYTGKEPHSFVRWYPLQFLNMFKTLYRICRTLTDMERIWRMITVYIPYIYRISTDWGKRCPVSIR